MTDDGIDRRTLLQASSLAAVLAAAGCTVEVGGFEVSVNEDETPTPTYGYGGTPTGTSTPSSAATSTGTSTPTGTAAPADDYGQQAYGQYGYGG